MTSTRRVCHRLRSPGRSDCPIRAQVYRRRSLRSELSQSACADQLECGSRVGNSSRSCRMVDLWWRLRIPAMRKAALEQPSSGLGVWAFPAVDHPCLMDSLWLLPPSSPIESCSREASPCAFAVDASDGDGGGIAKADPQAGIHRCAAVQELQKEEPRALRIWGFLTRRDDDRLVLLLIAYPVRLDSEVLARSFLAMPFAVVSPIVKSQALAPEVGVVLILGVPGRLARYRNPQLAPSADTRE
jgi:hypothetical protein